MVIRHHIQGGCSMANGCIFCRQSPHRHKTQLLALELLRGNPMRARLGMYNGLECSPLTALREHRPSDIRRVMEVKVRPFPGI